MPHDEHRHRASLAQRERQQGEAALQAKADGAVIGGGKLVGQKGDGLAQAVACPPAADRCHRVPSQHRLVVVEAQPRAQAELPVQAVRRFGPGLSHLRLRLEPCVYRDQLVIDQVSVVAGDDGGGPDRVEAGQVGLRDHAQDT